MTVQEFARLGGKARAAKLTKDQRIESARKAGIASGIKRASKLTAKVPKTDLLRENI